MKWRKTYEKTPRIPKGESRSEQVLCCGPLGGYYLARWDGKGFVVQYGGEWRRKYFDDWMPLPKLPKGIQEWIELTDEACGGSDE